MPIIPTIVSSQTSEALQKGLQDLNRPLPDISTVPGNHVFTLGLQEIADGVALDAAQRIGWQFLISGQAMAAVDVSESALQPPVVTRLAEGNAVTDMATARKSLENLSQIQTSDYELRLLRIPGLRIDAFWLKSLAGMGDWVVVYRTIGNDFKGHVFPVSDFMAAIRNLAQQKLAAHDQPYELPYKSKQSGQQ